MKKIMIYTKKGRGGPRFHGSPLAGPAGPGADVLCICSLLCGALLGARVYMLFPQNSTICALAEAPLTEDPWRLALTVFVPDVFLLIAAVFFGLCAVGTCVLVCLPAVKGFFCAVTAAYLIERFAAKGFGYFALILLPGAVVSAAAVVLFSIDGVAMSRRIGSVLLFGSRGDPDLKGFLFAAGRNAALAAAGSALCGICARLFLRLF